MDFNKANNNAEEFENNSPAKEINDTQESIGGQEQEYEEGVFTTPPPIFYYSKALMEEKPNIKRTALGVGLAFLLVSILPDVVGFILYRMPVYLGVEQEIIYNFFSNDAVIQAQQIILSILFFTVPFIFVFKLFGHRISDLVPLEKPQKGKMLPLFLMGIAFCGFANVAVSLAGSILQQFGIEYEVNFNQNPRGLFGFLLSFIATAITPALVEEFACRGVVMGALKKYGEGFAIVVSSILFGLMHGNFTQIPFAFLVGIACGYITIKSGSLWPAVAVHCYNNALSVLLDYSFTNFVAFRGMVYLITLSVSLLLGILALNMVKGNKDYFTLKNAEMECSEGNKYRWFFTAVPIIIFVVISILKSMAYFVV